MGRGSKASKFLLTLLTYRIGPRALRTRRLSFSFRFQKLSEHNQDGQTTVYSQLLRSIRKLQKRSAQPSRMTSRRRVSLPSSAVHLLSETPCIYFKLFFAVSSLPAIPSSPWDSGSITGHTNTRVGVEKASYFSYLLLASPPPSRVFQISSRPIWTLL